MRFQVPQFIEVEDKIFGPLTLKQFLYTAGGAAVGFIIWSIFPRNNCDYYRSTDSIIFHGPGFL